MRAAVLLVLLGCAAPVHTLSATDHAQIEGVLRAQQAAWNRGDLLGYMNGYAHTDDLVFASGGHVRKGWQEAYDHYVARYGNDKAGMGTLHFELTETDALGPDSAQVHGTWALTDTPNAGHGGFVLVFQRRAEGWRIVRDETSSATP